MSLQPLSASGLDQHKEVRGRGSYFKKGEKSLGNKKAIFWFCCPFGNERETDSLSLITLLSGERWYQFHRWGHRGRGSGGRHPRDWRLSLNGVSGPASPTCSWVLLFATLYVSLSCMHLNKKPHRGAWGMTVLPWWERAEGRFFITFTQILRGCCIDPGLNCTQPNPCLWGTHV